MFSKGQRIFPAGRRITAEGGGTFPAGKGLFSKGGSINAAGYGTDFRCRTISIINGFISSAPGRGILAGGFILITKGCRTNLSCLGQIAEGRSILPGSDGINAKSCGIGLGRLGPLAKRRGPFFRCLCSLPEGSRIAAASHSPFPESYRIVPAGHIVGRWSRIVCLLASKGQGVTAGSCAILADDRSPHAVRGCTRTDGYGIFFHCLCIDTGS